MSKRDVLMQGLANVRESMGDFGDAAVRGAPALGPRALPARLQGVVRSKDVSHVELDRIVPDPDQPREDFELDALERLARSLQARGQLQPIRCRWDEDLRKYVIVCGERRWRAARMAGLASLACVIVDGPMSAEERLAVQLVENAVREDLRPVEQARAYQKLMTAQGWSARQLAAELAIHHAQVVRALALLELPDAVQEQVEQGGLSPATAYEVSKLPDPVLQAEVAQAAVAEGLKRSEVAELVQAVKAKRPAPAMKPDPLTLEVEPGVVVKITWKKPGPEAAQVLKRALKLLQERRRDEQAA